MNADIIRLRELVDSLQGKLKIAKESLDLAVKNCQHNWSVVPDHVYHKEYTIPGDPPGTMGVDWRGPIFVDPHTEKRWKRTCMKCGEVEYTSKIQTETIDRPYFGP